MLAKLFGSAARAKILKIFLLNSGKKYYIRQLARDLRLQVNSVRRELEHLVSFGVLKSSTVEDGQLEYMNIVETDVEKTAHNLKVRQKKPSGGDKKYYQANGDFVLFEELRNLMSKSQLMSSEEFINELKVACRPKLLILTGFFANNENSPVDIFVVGRVNKARMLKLISSLETELDREINYTVMDYKEFIYRRDITDVFIYNILQGRKIVAVNELEIGEWSG